MFEINIFYFLMARTRTVPIFNIIDKKCASIMIICIIFTFSGFFLYTLLADFSKILNYSGNLKKPAIIYGPKKLQIDKKIKISIFL